MATSGDFTLAIDTERACCARNAEERKNGATAEPQRKPERRLEERLPELTLDRIELEYLLAYVTENVIGPRSTDCPPVIRAELQRRGNHPDVGVRAEAQRLTVERRETMSRAVG